VTFNAFLSLLHGAGVTTSVSLIGIALGVPFGLMLALLRWRRVLVLAQLTTVFVSLLRSTPAVTLCLLIFFALPVVGIEVDALTAAVLTLALNTSAFNCEIWRAGLMSFPYDQIEAARTFGMGGRLTFWRIIFPQLWRTCLPSLVNEMTLLIKGSTAIAVIGVAEITRAAIRIGAQTYDPLPPMLAATGIYLVLVLVFVGIQRLTELAYGKAGGAP
jgi:His/Glu/Gln/Arg/opine family amino acid ABC transporter permease subunit